MNKVVVFVNGNQYIIPAEKAIELQQLLLNWQRQLQAQEAQQNDGRQVING